MTLRRKLTVERAPSESAACTRKRYVPERRGTP
jgi:hypothetical protein